MPLISYVFEVRNKGSLENGLANLKHAYDTQRSKPFQVIANERDMRKAEDSLRPHLMGSSHEVGDSTTILSGQGVQRIYQSLRGCFQSPFSPCGRRLGWSVTYETHSYFGQQFA